MTVIRQAEAGDFTEIAAIQAVCPEASQWDVADYALYHLWVAVCENRVAGFLVARAVGEGECELLNLAVAPEFRRQGVARALVSVLTGRPASTIFLEVRESNSAAQGLYKSLGFQQISSRLDYYDSPMEAAIVLKFHSC